MQMIKQPRKLNAMYSIANQWLKVNTKTKLSGYGMTSVKTLDYQEEPKRGKKNERNDKDKREEPKKEEKENETNRKDLSEIDCFNCGKKGHCANKCPASQKKETKNIGE